MNDDIDWEYYNGIMQDSARYQWLIKYHMDCRTDLDDKFNQAGSEERFNKIIDDDISQDHRKDT